VEWAEKRLDKAEGDLKKAQDSNDVAQITHWEAEVEHFKTQEALYRVTRDALQKDERSQFQRIKDIVGDKRSPLGERLWELLKKEGITIVSLATAVGMTIATIVLAVSRLFPHIQNYYQDPRQASETGLRRP
jgi:hypothetical protein